MRTDEATLLDIVTAAQRVTDFVTGFTLEEFQADEKTWSAVLYQISVIGEAVKRLSDPFKALHSSIPWPQMAGMRNLVIHAYDAVDLKRVWQTATVSIPHLLTAMTPLLPPAIED
jgi:uncharacterized protein with HEPN domain